jgi:hypothetical protein
VAAAAHRLAHRARQRWQQRALPYQRQHKHGISRNVWHQNGSA